MTAPDEPNQSPNKKRGLRRVPPGLWLCLGLGLVGLLLGAAGRVGWDARQRAQRQAEVARMQAAAPVFSIAEDGAVSVNGQALVVGADGSPPAVLAALEGGPPAELTQAGVWPWPYPFPSPPPGELRRTYHGWRYPRLGLDLWIRYRVAELKARYQGILHVADVGTGLQPGCTLELRGKRWWLGRPGPEGGLTRESLRTFPKVWEVREPYPSRFPRLKDFWTLHEGKSVVQLAFKDRRPPEQQDTDLLSQLALDTVTLTMPDVAGAQVLWEKPAPAYLVLPPPVPEQAEKRPGK